MAVETVSLRLDLSADQLIAEFLSGPLKGELVRGGKDHVYREGTVAGMLGLAEVELDIQGWTAVAGWKYVEASDAFVAIVFSEEENE